MSIEGLSTAQVVNRFGAGTSAVEVVSQLIEMAGEIGASDVHVVPHEQAAQVRMRVDGALRDTHHISRTLTPEVISRIKILSGLRTDEHQSAQDGRFRHLLPYGRFLDVRVSIVPTYHGENAILRLLTDHRDGYSLKTLGCTYAHKEKLIRALTKPHGMILATGPTGSGKTTLLYALLRRLIAPDIHIVTIEDPVEYAMEGVTQIPVSERTGLTFGAGLRSILRQDPDVIMVGEIRDRETAGVSINAALTGHRVLSTLHTNDAASAVTRLFDMGVEPYLVASTLSLVVSQRLVRKLCSHCKKEKRLTESERASLAAQVPEEILMSCAVVSTAQGCAQCNGSGYRGRIGVQEVLEVDSLIRSRIMQESAAHQLRESALKQGDFESMMSDGFRKVAAGITTLEEILKMHYE